MASLQELLGTAQAGRSRADDGDALAGRRRDRDGMSFKAALVIDAERLQLSAQDRLMMFIQNAGSLAELFMRADTPTDFRQGAGLVVQVGRL